MPFSSESKAQPIAFFAPELVSGGTQRHLLEVLRLIDRTRFSPLVIAAKSGGGLLGTTIRSAGVELIELRLGPTMLSRDFVRCVRETAAVLQRRQVRIVQYFEWRSAMIALAAAGRIGGCRIVAARRSVPKERGVQRILAELAVRAAHRIVVNAELLRPKGRAGRRTDVIPSGVDTDLFRPPTEVADAKRRLGIAAERPLIGTVGRLEPRKGTATLLAAFAALRGGDRHDAALVVVGDGPLRTHLAAEADRLGVASHVKFLGDRADVLGVLQALDVFVLPSRTEGMSNALLEAMATARPVVATAVGGTPEVVNDGSSGLLVPADAAPVMTAAITRVLDDAALAARLGAAARQTVEARYGAKSMVRRLEAVYAAVASGDVATRGRDALVQTRKLDSLEECR